MSGPAIDVASATPLGLFADGLLAADLPALPVDRRQETVAFVERRAAVLPSVTRFGVASIALLVHGIGTVLGHGRVRGLVLRLPLPLLSEYPRLIRSLGYAFVWETWPGTASDGAVPASDGTGHAP